MSSVHEGHRKRAKQLFLQNDFKGMSQHNILELILFYALPRRDTNKLAHILIERFGSISGVFDAPFDELIKVDGIGENAATLLKLFPSVSRLYNEDKCDVGNVLDSVEKAGRYLVPKFIGYNNEIFYIVCLDNKMKILYSGILFEGTANTVPIAIRKITEIVIRVNAAHVILSHNHPQGLCVPSAEDISSTRLIYRGLQQVGVNLRDHIIVAKGDYISLSQAGVLYE